MIEIRKCDQLVQIYVIKKEQLSNILEMKKKIQTIQNKSASVQTNRKRESNLCVNITLATPDLLARAVHVPTFFKSFRSVLEQGP